MANTVLTETLKGKRFLAKGQIVEVVEVIDFIAAERAVGVPNAFVVVLGDDAQEYIVFDSGEIQDNDGNVVGQQVMFGADSEW